MPGDTCIVCGNTRKKDKSISMHRFPRDDGRRKRWVEALDLEDMDIKDHYCVCSRHFPDADATKDPQLTLGKRFASPKKYWTERSKRAKKRNEASTMQLSVSRSLVSTSTSCSSSRSQSQTPAVSPPPPMITSVAEQLPGISASVNSTSDSASADIFCSVGLHRHENTNVVLKRQQNLQGSSDRTKAPIDFTLPSF